MENNKNKGNVRAASEFSGTVEYFDKDTGRTIARFTGRFVYDRLSGIVIKDGKVNQPNRYTGARLPDDQGHVCGIFMN